MKIPQFIVCLQVVGLVCFSAIGQDAITRTCQPAPQLPPALLENSGQSHNCSLIYQPAPPNGWLVETCASDPFVPTPMQVVLDGVSKGNAAFVRIYHQSQNYTGTPQVAVIYANGFVRLKQNADPSPPIPFGASFILGPAYWPDDSTYYHNPQLTRLEIDTAWLPNGPLRMRAGATNHAFDVLYDFTLPPPRDAQTRMHVTQTYTATTSISISPTRRSEKQGFKLVQISSMFINEGGSCDGGFTDCHDVNAARFIGSDLEGHQVAFRTLMFPTFIFSSTLPLGSTWLDALHTDDMGWQGNTPNVRIALDMLPTDRTITPRGWIGATTNPNDDNVGLWLHDDGTASQAWTAGQRAQISYWLIAQDNPSEPWADLGLRNGMTFLNFEGSSNCYAVRDVNQSTTASVRVIPGYNDTALQLEYHIGSTGGNWAQVRCDFSPPLDLSAYDHLRLDWRGDPNTANSLQVGLITRDGTGDHIFARGYHHATHHSWWGQLVIPFQFLEGWAPGTTLNPAQVVGLFVSVVKDGTDDTGGAGSLAIDNLSADNVASRTIPADFSAVTTNMVASRAAAQWLASQQQQATGLLKSWVEESICTAHTYDQALALLVFSHAGMWTQADALAGALAGAQSEDGSWYKSYNCSSSSYSCVHCHKWEGDIAWAVYALSRYLALGGSHPQARTAMKNGAAWLTTRQASDGCLVIDHTEGTIDAWWALQAAGLEYRDEAERLKNCLLTYYWDNVMGRFKGGRDWQQPYLDNQTWGAAFLRAIGREEDARRALSYAYEVLRLPGQGGQVGGFDGQGGPWSVWNEGTAQYIAAGGKGADDLLLELLAQQEHDGAMPGSPDDFAGGGVWTTRWHGAAPTAWLYFALTDEPFHATRWSWLPLIMRNSVTDH